MPWSGPKKRGGHSQDKSPMLPLPLADTVEELDFLATYGESHMHSAMLVNTGKYHLNFLVAVAGLLKS